MKIDLVRLVPIRLILPLCFLAFAAFDTANASKFNVLYTFQGPRSDGDHPIARLIMDKEGDLFGVTSNGGKECGHNHGCGTVFEIAPSGTEKSLFFFRIANEGLYPSGLAKDKNGTIYGTTSNGGNQYGFSDGTVFKLAPDGTETVLYSFAYDKGLNPIGLAKDTTGNLYGTSFYEGGSGCSNYGCGLVFKVAPDGTESTLYTFKAGSDGANPDAAPILDSAGNLYGTTTAGGGTGCSGYGCGTVYKLAPDGTEIILYAFSGGTDGSYPEAPLTMDSAGNLYGTANGGGANGLGVVFKLTPKGTEAVLHSFAGGSDGEGTFFDGVHLDSSGNLYGATTYGGGTGCNGYGCGIVYRIATDGTETILHAFTGGYDGAFPESDLISDAAGNLYGSAGSGGKESNGGCCGTVFKLTP